MFILRNIKASFYGYERHTFHEGADLRIKVNGDSATVSFLTIDEMDKCDKWVNFIFGTQELRRALDTILFYYDHGIYDKWIEIGDDQSIRINYNTEYDGSVDITLFIFHNDYHLYVSILDARAILLLL